MNNWLVQGLISNLVWEILIVGAGIAMAILRKRDSKLVAPVLYGIVTVACLLVMWFTITGRSLLSHPVEETTADNIEGKVKLWSDDLAISLERTDLQGSYFSYTARLHGSDPVEIFRAKEKPGYLQFQSHISFSPEHQAILAKMSKADFDRATQEVALEVSRISISYAIGEMEQNGKPIQTMIGLGKGVPIPSLNEAAFGDTFDEMTRTVVLVRAATNVILSSRPQAAK